MSLFGFQQHYQSLFPSYNLMPQINPYADSLYQNLALQARYYQYNQYNETTFPKYQQYQQYASFQPEPSFNQSFFDQNELFLAQQTLTVPKVKSPILMRKSWTSEEDKLLVAWVRENGLSSWEEAEDLIEGRTAKQCKQRWYNKNNKRKVNCYKKGKWTHEEDQLIRTLYKQYGPAWEKMAESLPGKSENSIKNRFYYYQRCIADQSVDHLSLFKYQNQDLSTANGTPDEKKFFVKTESEPLVQAPIQVKIQAHAPVLVKKEEYIENENLIVKQDTLPPQETKLEEMKRSLDASEAASEMDFDDQKFQSFLLQSETNKVRENPGLDFDEEFEVLQKKNFYFCEQNMKNLSRTVFLETFNPLQEPTAHKQKDSEENKVRPNKRIFVPKYKKHYHSKADLGIVKQNSASKSTTSTHDSNTNRVIEQVEKAVKAASLLYMSCLDDIKKSSNNVKDKEELRLMFKRLDSLEAVVMSSRSALESVNPTAGAQ